MTVLDMNIGFGILAFLAKNKFIDESIEVVLKLRSFVGSINNPTVISWVGVCLGSKLETEVFDDI